MTLNLTRWVTRRCSTNRSHFDLKVLLSNITKDKFQLQFVKSGGPGGQNVNKVNTKAVLRLSVTSASWIPQEVKEKLLINEKNIITKEGDVVIASEKYKSQYQNAEDAIEKFREMVRKAAFVPAEPSEEKLKLRQERKEKANEKRLEKKRRDSRNRNEKNIY